MNLQFSKIYQNNKILYLFIISSFITNFRYSLDKWLSPSDNSHPPSLLAVIVFCKACEDNSPMEILLQALGLEVMSSEDKKACDYGKAILEEKAARIRRRKIEQNLE